MISMSTPSRNVKKSTDTTVDTSERDNKRKKIIAGIFVPLILFAVIFAASPLALGDIETENDDGIAPIVSCNKGNNTLINSGDFAFTVESDLDIGSFLVYFNGSTEFTNPPPPYEYFVPLTGTGVVGFVIVVYDSAENRTITSFSFTYDTIAPTIYISPINGSTTELNMFSILTDVDVSEVNVTTESYVNTFTNSSFTVVDPWMSLGIKTITVIATDVAGNIQTSEFELTFDAEPPVILINDTTNSSIVELNVSSYTTTVLIGNSSSSMNTTVVSPYIIDMNWTVDGIYEIWVFVNTTVGATYTINKTVIYDTTIPSYIVSPTNGSVVEAIPLSFTPIDATPVQMFVNGTNITTTYVYNPSWTVNGPYSFTIISVDASGNVNESSLIYILDTEFPIISLMYVSNGSVTTNNTITINVSDTSIDSVWVSTDNITYVLLDDSIDPYYIADLSTYFVSSGKYDVYFRANDTVGHETIVRYEFIWSSPQNITISDPTNTTVVVYTNPSFSDFSTDNTEFLGYYNESSYGWINFSVQYILNTSMVYMWFTNTTTYNQSTMNSTFSMLQYAFMMNNISFQPFTFDSGIFSFSATTYLDGNSSYRFYIYYNDGVNEAIGTFTIVYDDTTPLISWTSANSTTLKFNQNTYVNLTSVDDNLYSMHVFATITNISGTFIVRNITLYGPDMLLYELNLYEVESTVQYTLNVYITATDLAGNIQSVYLKWTVDAKNPPQRAQYNYLIGLGIPAIVVFSILGIALKKSKNNGGSIGGY